MFFPTLSTMRRYQINEVIYNKLDAWLGTRRKAVIKYLSPLQFSIDSDIDEEMSISLFSISTFKEIGILKERHDVICSNCEKILGSYKSPSDIPEYIHCNECNVQYKVTEDMVVIWFELIRDPEPEPYNKIAIFFNESSLSTGKDLSLRPEHIKHFNNNPVVRGLINSYNERFRNL